MSESGHPIVNFQAISVPIVAYTFSIGKKVRLAAPFFEASAAGDQGWAGGFV